MHEIKIIPCAQVKNIFSASNDFCSSTSRKLREKYEELLNLPYSSMSGKLFAKGVITLPEKNEINHLIGIKQMEKVVDIVISSLNSKCTTKYKGFLQAMEENEDEILQTKAKEFGKRIDYAYTQI